MLTFEEAIFRLKNEDVVVVPTETVYGLAGSIRSNNAIKKIFRLKNRPFFNPLIVHIAKINDLSKIAKNIPEKAWKLANFFFPGPLTLVLEKKSESISNLITSGSKKVAVRMPNHKITLKLINKLGCPIAAPSANPYNYLSPTSSENVKKFIPELENAILDGGECVLGIESTVLAFNEKNVELLRHGGISIEAIESVLNEKLIINISNIRKKDSPGMVNKHYSPKSKLIICQDIYKAISLYPNNNIGILSFNKRLSIPVIKKEIVLSESGDIFEATKNFFSSLYILDSLNLDIILVKKFQNHGLGLALNDRLLRASSRLLT